MLEMLQRETEIGAGTEGGGGGGRGEEEKGGGGRRLMVSTGL